MEDGEEMVGMVLLLRRYQLLHRLFLSPLPCLPLNAMDAEQCVDKLHGLGCVIGPCLCAARESVVVALILPPLISVCYDFLLLLLCQ